MGTTKTPSIDNMVSLRISHLGMVQGTIARMSGFSASVKNFCVTITAAVLAITFQQRAPILLWAALAIIVVFCIMDTYYLALERRYRNLYEEVAARPIDLAQDLSLNAPYLYLRDYLGAVRSGSVDGFYMLLILGEGVLLVIAAQIAKPV